MLASLVSNLINFDYWLSNPWLPIMSLFQLWMFIDALRRREWLWAVFIFIGFGVSALFYYFAVYRCGSTVWHTRLGNFAAFSSNPASRRM